MKPELILIRIFFLAITCLPPAAGYACEGADLVEANRLAEHMMFVNRTCNEAGSVEDSMNCLREEWSFTVLKLDNLPAACRQILKEYEPQE